VQLTHSGPSAGVLVAKLPGNSAKRTAIFATVNKVLATYKLPPQTDVGQTYLYVDF
jgi:hypothetical protein